MKTYKLKSVARRGSMLTAAFVVAAAAFIPAATSFADALNPLTERSLTLSSSSPGWSNKDGSGNSTYAQPNSGANGEKTGNTFSFRVSSGTPLEAFTFQYCTKSAGFCMGPGNNQDDGEEREANGPTAYAGERSDLEIVTNTPSEVSAADYTGLFNSTLGQPSEADSFPNRDNTDGNFIVLHKATAGAAWQHSAGWTMETDTVQNGNEPGATSTNKPNFITLKNTTALPLAVGNYVKIIFFGTDTNYIVNPGEGAFFVKINSYSDSDTQDASTLVDGGVTVANVMNRSIEIQTKVLETMDFSVGTVDPNTLDSTGGLTSEFGKATNRVAHTPCTPIAQQLDPSTSDKAPNVLQLGNATGEFSLETLHTYSTHSYWRLSSNSSAGATVYYSGVTLSNTVNDQIEPVNGGNGTAAAPSPGSEQFGLAMDNGTDFDPETSLYKVSYATERDSGKVYQNGEDNGKTGIHTASLTTDNILTNGSWHDGGPQLYPLRPLDAYKGGTGNVNADYTGGINTQFAFDSESNLIPAPFASGTEVVDCVTGKMRYIANIAATTPAGIYTTKINYIASPKY